MNGTVTQKLSAFLKVQKILDNFCFSEQIFQLQKTVVGCPCMVPKVSISARELIVITNWSKSNAELFIQSILYTRHFYKTCITKKNDNEPEETSPRGLSGRKKRQNLKFLSECYPQDKINYTSPEYVWPIPSKIGVRIFL